MLDYKKYTDRSRRMEMVMSGYEDKMIEKILPNMVSVGCGKIIILSISVGTERE